MPSLYLFINRSEYIPDILYDWSIIPLLFDQSLYFDESGTLRGVAIQTFGHHAHDELVWGFGRVGQSMVLVVAHIADYLRLGQATVRDGFC